MSDIEQLDLNRLGYCGVVAILDLLCRGLLMAALVMHWWMKSRQNAYRLNASG